jgi:hypothetical protein|tara:strand:+ start:269 stop:811 length:543 start_codon:yes stop_codon:yes gene_type:complete
MKFFDLKSFYILTDIKEHQQNKNKLLSLINKMELSTINNSNNVISKTDWNLPKETKREYINFFYKMVTPYMNDMAVKLKCKFWDISNAWYQVYKEQDTHNWHIHENNNYTNVYYLDLPEQNIKTELYDVKDNKVINEIQLKEGQLFTFPAHIIHRSPPNLSNKIKTIISFNSNFTQINLT